MRLPVGVDISETWPVDFCLEDAKLAKESLEKRIAKLETAPKDETPGQAEARARALEANRAALAKVEEQLRDYVPGTGPIFTVGHIPGAKRAEFLGKVESLDSRDLVAYHVGDFAWAREVVRWAVKGHSQWRSAKGKDLPFVATNAECDGRPYQVVAPDTLEQYAPVMKSLALVVLRPQQLDEAEKNA